MPTPARTLTLGGETLTLRQWSARTGLAVNTITARLDQLGWPIARALSTPADKRFRPGRPSHDLPRPAPRMRRHSSGQAYARWRENGQRHYLYFGKWGTEDAREEYRRFVIEWNAGEARR